MIHTSKSMVLCAAMIVSGAGAQELECPKRMPGHVAPKAKLTGSGAYSGPNKEFKITGGYMVVPDGYDRYLELDEREVNWFACSYGPKHIWWKRLDPKTTECAVQLRRAGNSEVSVKLVCN